MREWRTPSCFQPTLRSASSIGRGVGSLVEQDNDVLFPAAG
ncbi:MAG: hypothetical protein OJF52_000677 [Nitrospira sp.]|nr:MAG: hypothetical protein OJF52_000677 [Nitrospira sp.]